MWKAVFTERFMVFRRSTELQPGIWFWRSTSQPERSDGSNTEHQRTRAENTLDEGTVLTHLVSTAFGGNP